MFAQTAQLPKHPNKSSKSLLFIQAVATWTDNTELHLWTETDQETYTEINTNKSYDNIFPLQTTKFEINIPFCGQRNKVL